MNTSHTEFSSYSIYIPNVIKWQLKHSKTKVISCFAENSEMKPHGGLIVLLVRIDCSFQFQYSPVAELFIKKFSSVLKKLH